MALHRRTSETRDQLFHRLWTASVGADHYDKNPWRTLYQRFTDCAADTKEQEQILAEAQKLREQQAFPRALFRIFYQDLAGFQLMSCSRLSLTVTEGSLPVRRKGSMEPIICHENLVYRIIESLGTTQSRVETQSYLVNIEDRYGFCLETVHGTSMRLHIYLQEETEMLLAADPNPFYV